MPHLNSLENSTVGAPRRSPAKVRRPVSVHSCNFRTAGRLSNEDARFMSEMHEKVAQHVSNALDTYLGTSVEVRLETLDQLTIKEHVTTVSSRSLVIPYFSSAFFVEMDFELVFPIVDLLLGGVGGTTSTNRDLSEIEEEIMHDVVLMIARQCQTVWRMPEEGLVAESRIKPVGMQQAFSMSEKATVLRFCVECGGTSGSFRIVLTNGFLNALLKQGRQDVPQKKARIIAFALPPLRERILDCDTEVAAELTGLHVTLRDLVALKAGSVLKLRAPIRTPATLTVGGHSLFEAIPVRNGSQRAAHLGQRVPTTDWVQER